MKRTKLFISLTMCAFCLSFLVVGVWSAVSTSHSKAYDGTSSTVYIVANGNGLIYNGVQNTTYGSRPAILYSL